MKSFSSRVRQHLNQFFEPIFQNTSLNTFFYKNVKEKVIDFAREDYFSEKLIELEYNFLSEHVMLTLKDL